MSENKYTLVYTNTALFWNTTWGRKKKKKKKKRRRRRRRLID